MEQDPYENILFILLALRKLSHWGRGKMDCLKNDIFKFNFLHKNYVLIHIWLKSVSTGPINNISALV